MQKEGGGKRRKEKIQAEGERKIEGRKGSMGVSL